MSGSAARSCRLTKRDVVMLEASCLAFRVASSRQFCDHWFCGDLANTRRRLRRLVDSGWLSRLTIRARSLPILKAPTIQWQPGNSAPNFEVASYQLRSRWLKRPVRDCTAYIATSAAAEMFGGKAGGLKNEAQATHDLGVTQIWMHYDQYDSVLARSWRGEDVMAETRIGQKLPDAFLVGSTDNVKMVVEFGGAYNAARLAEFHQDCQYRNLPYQVW